MEKTELQNQIGKRIRSLRKMKNIRQQDFAAMCNFEKSNLNRIESGGTNPTIFTLSIIAKNLGITLSKLLDF